MKKFYVSIDRCPKHNFTAVSIGDVDETGYGSGYRLLGGKCCGQWSQRVAERIVDERDLDEISDFVRRARRALKRKAKA